MVFTASLLGAIGYRDSVENKPERDKKLSVTNIISGLQKSRNKSTIKLFISVRVKQKQLRCLPKTLTFVSLHLFEKADRICEMIKSL